MLSYSLANKKQAQKVINIYLYSTRRWSSLPNRVKICVVV